MGAHPNWLVFHRLLAAVRSATIAAETMHLKEPPEDAPSRSHVAFEAEADQVVKQERVAREGLVHWLIDQLEDAPIAVITADGHVITFTDSTDGLCVVAPGNVHKLA